MSLEMLSAVWELDLERNEKDVLEVLAWHANADGICWPSKARIMYTKNLSESTVKRTLRSLKEMGLISVEAHAEGGRGKTPLYCIHPEKGAKKTPFNEWKEGQNKGGQDDQKGVTENRKGGQNSVKGVAAAAPEPSVEPRTENRQPTVSEAAAPLASPHTENVLQQLLSPKPVPLNKFYVTDLYNRLKERYDIRLRKEQFEFHLGQFKRMLDQYDPADEEIERVVTHMVEKCPSAPKLDALGAIQDVRLGRDTGEAWEGPAPWEAAKTADPGSNSEAAAARRTEGYEYLFT